MEPVRLNCYPPHPKQAEWIDYTGIAPGDDISITFVDCGRGWGKTVGDVLRAWNLATKINPGRRGLVTERTFPEIRKIFLPVWQQIIPRHLYNLNKSEWIITFNLPGAAGNSVIVLDSRRDAERHQGETYAWALNDELAKDRSPEAWEHIRGCVRDPHANALVCDASSTPVVGWYTQLLAKEGRLVKGTSFDNPYADIGWLRSLFKNWSPKKFREQVLAEHVAMTGLAWGGFKETDWPNGNMHWARFDPAKPWWISADIGLNSSYGIWQNHPAVDKNGRRIWDGRIDVRVGEYQPNGQTHARTLARIAEAYPGSPTRFYTGGDTETHRDHIDTGQRASEIIREVWKKAPPAIVTPTGSDRFKDLQYDRLDAAMFSVDGRRRMCVSRHMRRHDEPQRGVLEVIRLDTFPEKAPGGTGYLADNDSSDPLGLRHCRDDLMYYAVGRYPHNTARMTAA